MVSLSNHHGCITAGLVFQCSNMHDTMQSQYWKSEQCMYINSEYCNF